MSLNIFFVKNVEFILITIEKSDPNGMGVNLGCIEELDATEYDAIAFDGRKL